MRSASMLRHFMLALLLVSLNLIPIGLSPLSALSAPMRPSGTQQPQSAPRAWWGWHSLGGPYGASASQPVVGQNQDGRLEIFAGAGGLSGYIYHLVQTAPNGEWGSWTRLADGDTPATAPSVGRNTDGRLEILYQGLEVGGGLHFSIHRLAQTAPNASWSLIWSNLGTPVGVNDLFEPYLGKDWDGRLSVFALGQNDKNIWHTWQNWPGSSSWNSYLNLGKPPTPDVSPVIAVERNQDGRIALFVLGSNHEVYHAYQQTVNDESSWSGWVGFGQPAGMNIYDLTASHNADGRLGIFSTGLDGVLYHKWQIAINSSWSNWGALGKPTGISVSSPVVGTTADGRMDVYTLGSDAGLWHLDQSAPSDGWGTWEGLGKPVGVSLTGQIAVGRNQDGDMVVVAVGSDGALWWNLQGTTVVPLCHILTLQVSPAGAGTIARSPAPGCLAGLGYYQGTVVNLTANASAGYAFNNWSGAVTGSTNPTTVTINGDQTVIANFRTVLYTLKLYLPLILK